MRLIPHVPARRYRRAVRAPWGRRDAYDLALTAGLGLLATVSLMVGGDEVVVGPEAADYSRPVGIALTAACIAPLAVRRRYPLTVLVMVTAAIAPHRVMEIPEPFGTAIAFYIAFYTAGAFGGRRRQLVRAVSALTITGLVIWEIDRTADTAPDGRFALLTALTTGLNAIYLAAAWFMGDLVRNRRRREAELEAIAEELRAAQAERSEKAVLGERLRIARDLHDVLGHHVSVMGVQAGAARRVLESRPEEVPPLLSSIEGSSRDAVIELQRLLGLLREHDGAGNGAGPDGQPGIARLADLAADMRDAGLAVQLRVDEVGAVPAAVDLSAYRIVQEALTNALKHAGPGTMASVDVRRTSGAVEVVVLDDGAPPGARRTAGSGNGLVGMRERVALTGGELRTGPRADAHGWEVRAWFPA